MAAGLDPEYRVLDEPRAARLSLAAWDEALDAFLTPAAPERVELLARYGPDTLREHGADGLRAPPQPGREPAVPPALPPVAAGDEQRSCGRRPRRRWPS